MSEEELKRLYIEFQLLGQHIKQLEDQNSALNNQLIELISTKQSLDDINNVKKGTEILVPLSGGIYAKAELKDNSNFIVNIGANSTVIKDADETKKLIQNQIDEIEKLQKSLMLQLETQTSKAVELEQEINKISSLEKEK